MKERRSSSEDMAVLVMVLRCGKGAKGDAESRRDVLVHVKIETAMLRLRAMLGRRAMPRLGAMLGRGAMLEPGARLESEPMLESRAMLE